MPTEAEEPSADPSLRSMASRLPVQGTRISHLMLIVAAVALGIVGVRGNYAEMRALQFSLNNPGNWFVLASPAMLSGSAAFVTARLLPPRRSRAEIFRQPGFIANCVVMASLALCLTKELLMNYTNGTLINISTFFFSLFSVVAEAGGSVFVAWMTLALAGCWIAETTLIDRMGRALGMLWIIAYFVYSFAWMLWLS